MAKINEQRKRRYMGEIISKLVKKDEKTFSWSRNNISPGTNFMGNMMKYLNSSNFEDRINNICINLKDYKVSGIDEMGEGEIKILHYINNNKNDNYIIYSPDSDVIILLLMKSANSNLNLFMLRYDQQLSTYKNPVYNLVDINHYKNILYEYVSSRMNKKVDITAVIMDIVFILTIFGDDFLPKLETVRVNTDINLIMDHYILNLIKYGYILINNINNHKYEINIENFMSFLKSIQKKEDYFLRRNAKYHVSSNYNRIVNDVVGYNMNILRELIVEYIWKFIYFNKPEFISLSPMNAHSHIDIELLDSFMNKVEPNINKNVMSKFIKGEYKNEKLWDKMLKIINDYYIEILNVIDGNKLKKANIYSNEIFFIEALPNQLLMDIIKYFYFHYEIPITVPLKIHIHDKLMIQNYNSHENPHKSKINRLKDNEVDYYKLEHKLDNYYKILNPRDKFYYDIYFKNEIDYSNYYKLNFHDNNNNKNTTSSININHIISDYLKGFNWVVNYYHNTNPKYKDIDLTWYFRHNRSPLLKDIVNHSNTKLLNVKMTNTFIINISINSNYMTPLEHYLLVSPLNNESSENELEEQLIKALDIKMDKIKKIIKFIKTYPKYYYELNKIHKELKNERIIDCSGSIFLSKCHLLFMENYISMISFINDYRKL
jgi:5'-3' exonuclease